MEFEDDFIGTGFKFKTFGSSENCYTNALILLVTIFVSSKCHYQNVLHQNTVPMRFRSNVRLIKNVTLQGVPRAAGWFTRAYSGFRDGTAPPTQPPETPFIDDI